MVRFFCDRCGEEIDKNSPFSNPFSDVENHVAGTFYIESVSFAEPRSNKFVNSYVNGNVYLCEDCRGRLDRMVDKFMKDGKQS